jgi:hypothetical protein
LQDITLVNRTIGTLFIDDGKAADRIPPGSELFDRLHHIVVTKAEITSEAETDYRHGDEMVAGAREAED